MHITDLLRGPTRMFNPINVHRVGKINYFWQCVNNLHCARVQAHWMLVVVPSSVDRACPPATACDAHSPPVCALATALRLDNLALKSNTLPNLFCSRAPTCGNMGTFDTQHTHTNTLQTRSANGVQSLSCKP